MTDRVGTAGPGCPAANHIKMAALRYPFANHVGTAALGCRADGTRVPHLARRVEATAQKTPIGAASGKGASSQAAERLPFGAVSGKGTTSQAAERFPFGVVSARARLRRLRKNTTFREIGKGTTSVVPITLFPSSSRAGVSQRGNLLSRVFSQAVRSRLLFLLLLLLSVQVAWSSALGPSKPNSPQSAAPSFNSTRAMQYVREVVAFGPRAIGSANHKKVENYIHSHVKGDLVEDDAFTATTPEGKFPVRNIIAKFPGTRDGIIVIAGHYDTNIPCAKPDTSAQTTAAPRPRCFSSSPINFAEGNATATASGCCGPMVKKPSKNGPRPTVSTAPGIWLRSGRTTALSERSRHSS